MTGALLILVERDLSGTAAVEAHFSEPRGWLKTLLASKFPLRTIASPPTAATPWLLSGQALSVEAILYRPSTKAPIPVASTLPFIVKLPGRGLFALGVRTTLRKSRATELPVMLLIVAVPERLL